jgi:hypothetical protein
LLHPELVVSATREEKAHLDAHPAEVYLSANRTCEMGLQQATGMPYESFIFTLEEMTRPKDHTLSHTQGTIPRRESSSEQGGQYSHDR